MPAEPFRISIVAGVTPDKWVRIWGERQRSPVEVELVDDAEQVSVVLGGRVDMGFVRLPVDRSGLHVIPLYDEVQVAVLPREHVYAELDSMTVADLDGEHRHVVSRELSLRQAVEAVAAGTGVVIAPKSLARLHQRKDVALVEVTDLPTTGVGLAWPADDAEDERRETFIGIVRGRSARSSRGLGRAEASSEKSARSDKGTTSAQPGKASGRSSGKAAGKAAKSPRPSARRRPRDRRA